VVVRAQACGRRVASAKRAANVDRPASDEIVVNRAHRPHTVGVCAHIAD